VLNGDVVCAVCALAGFGATYDLGGDAEGFALGDDVCCGGGLAVDLHAVPHVVDAEHFLVGGGAGFLDGFEDWGDWQEVVFDMMHSCAEADALGLAAAGAVHHAVDAVAVFGEELFDDGCVGAGGAEEGVAHGHVGLGERIGHPIRPAVEVLLVGGEIDSFGVFIEIVIAEQIVAGAGQAVAADAGVLEGLVVGLAGGGEADDGEAGLDVGIVDDCGAIHDDDCAGIDGDGAGEVADIGRLAAAAVDTDAVFAQGGEEVFGAGNELGEGLAGDRAGVTVDGAGNKDAVDRADAEQVVDIHDEAILRGFTETGGVARLAVVQVGEGALGAGAVGVDDVTLVGVTGQNVGSDLAKGTREDASVEVVDDGMDFGFRGGDAALGVAISGIAHGKSGKSGKCGRRSGD